MLRKTGLVVCLCCPVLPATAEPSCEERPEGGHLDHEALMMLDPEPNIRPRLDNGGEYAGGGIGVLIYEGVNAMDAMGPYQVFATAGLRPMLISASQQEDGSYKTVVTSNSGAQLVAHRTIANTPTLDVLVITGGAVETAQLATNTTVLRWIRDIHEHTHWTTSVCTGSWVLGAAGLLDGKVATSNWYHAAELLEQFGAIPAPEERYVFDGKIVTAAGVTAGIDMALALVKEVFSHDLTDGRDFTQAVMLDMQYDPDPPVVGGSPERTEPGVYEGMLNMYDYFGLDELVRAIPMPY